jgi:hypothetical protein
MKNKTNKLMNNILMNIMKCDEKISYTNTHLHNSIELIRI